MVLGIFDWIVDWFYDICYSITRTILRIVDFISQAVNKISGVDDITVDGQTTDFVTYVLRSSKVMNALAIACVIGTMLLIIFTVIAVIRTMYKVNSEETPLGVSKKAFKNLFLLICVPTFMLVFVYLTNAIVKAMYQATSAGTTSLAQYMFGIFGESAAEEKGNDFSIFINESVKYSDSCDTIRDWLELNDFDFMYSYIIGGIVIYLLLSTSMMLVERIISIALLFIVSPFVVSAAVVDDGQRFKQWRDQILAKFLTGHGAIIAINIYLMIVSLIMDSSVVFFDSSALNSFVKLLFIAGGALSLKSVQAIVGNLVSAGAGDKAVAENDRATHSMARAIGSAVSAPFRAARGAYNYAQDSKRYGAGAALAMRMGFKTEKDYHMPGWTNDNKNDNIPKSNGENMVNSAISGGGGGGENAVGAAVNNSGGGVGNNDNSNNNNNDNNHNVNVNNIIANGPNIGDNANGDNANNK